jgi:hypothetical protein
MNQTTSYVVVFLGYTLIMSLKDVISRYLLVNGLPVAHLLLTAGTVAFLFAMAVSLFRSQRLSIASPKYQTIRLILDAVAWASATQAFKLLNATSISIISKAYIPLLILLGPFLGNLFSRKQNLLAVAALLAMTGFAFFSRAPNESLIGYFYLLISTITVTASYIMLRHSTLKESPFIVVATPAAACVLVGLVWGGQIGMPLNVSVQTLFLEFVCGLLIYGLYTASIYRYRLLPVGLAEYPTLLTAFFILPSEYFLFGLRPSELYLGNLAIVLVLIGSCVYLNLAKKMPAAVPLK